MSIKDVLKAGIKKKHDELTQVDVTFTLLTGKGNPYNKGTSTAFTVKSLFREGADQSLKDSLGYTTNGLEHNQLYSLAIFIDNLGVNTIEKGMEVSYNGDKYNIEGILKYEYETRVLLSI